MPLFKSVKKSSMGKNIAAEMEAGKPPKQAIAVAYSARRQAMGKKKMAQGGEIMAASSRPDADDGEIRSMKMLGRQGMIGKEELDARAESRAQDSIDDASDSREMDMLDSHPTRHQAELRSSSIVDRIMRRRMSDGGEVDLQDNGDESLNKEDQMSFEAARKHAYFDDSQIDAQPEDSNMHGDDLDDADAHDMVDRIIRKIRSRR